MSPAVETQTIASPLGDVVLWSCEPDAGAASTGAQAPVVYLHSAAGEGGPLVSALFEALGEGGRSTFAPMMPGFGGSEGITDVDDIEDLVFHLLDLFAVLDLVAERRPHLVGLSMGGWLGAEFACRYSDRIRSLSLVNPAGLYIAGASIGEIFGQPLEELAETVFANADHPVAQMMRQLGEALRIDPASVPFEALAPYMEAQAAAARLGWNPYLHNPRLRGRLGRIKAPTLVVAADDDKLIPFAHPEAYSQEIPGARLVRVPGGHMLSLENPGGLAEVILDHVASVEAALASA